MGWIYFHDTGEFLGELPGKDPSKSEAENRVIRKQAMVAQIEKHQPGTFENAYRNPFTARQGD